MRKDGVGSWGPPLVLAKQSGASSYRANPTNSSDQKSLLHEILCGVLISPKFSFSRVIRILPRLLTSLISTLLGEIQNDLTKIGEFLGVICVTLVIFFRILTFEGIFICIIIYVLNI